MLVQRPDAARKLQRQYGLTRMPDSVLAPEIVPVVLVHDLSQDAFDDVVRNCIGMTSTAAVAAEFPMSILGQPTPSLGGPIVIDRLYVSSDTSQIVQIARPDVSLVSTLTQTSNKLFTDFDTPGQPGAFMMTGTDPVAPSRTTVANIRILADTPAIYEPRGGIKVATNGVPLLVLGLAANSQLQVNYEWREAPELG